MSRLVLFRLLALPTQPNQQYQPQILIKISNGQNHIMLNKPLAVIFVQLRYVLKGSDGQR